MMHTQGLQASLILLTINSVVCQIVFQNNGHAPPISPDISSAVTNTSIGSSLACETPIGKQGECVNIRKCPSLIASARRGDIQYLKRSVCGRQGKVTHLCCPDHVTNHPNKPVEPVPAAPPQFQSASDCGISPLQPGRIIGGQPVEFIGMFPWAAALYYDDNRNPVKCGGAIISERWVITAAHCILDIGPNFVRLGDLNLISEIDDLFQHPPQHIGIMRVVKHEQYEHRLSDPKGMMNDIALLKLKESIKFSDVVRPICLPNKVTPLLELERRQGVIAGWGATEFGGQGSSVMLWARVNISDQDQCRNSYGSAAVTVHRDRQMCANGNDPTVDRPDCGPGDAFELRCQGGVDTCAGDSGGPLIIDRQHLNRDRWYCEGIVSFGVGCGNGYFPGIYTKVDEYLPWISRHIQE